MKRLLTVGIVLAIALALVGCGRGNSGQTSATQVDTPPEPKAPAPPAPAAAPAPMPAEPTTPAPKPGKDGWVTFPSGLKYKDKKIGKGKEVTNQTRVTVHYKGWLDNGKVFDTSRKPGAGPFSFTVGNGEVIKGWDEGLKGMKVGGVRELTIPPALGYGNEDQAVIPANSTLHFDVEVLDAM